MQTIEGDARLGDRRDRRFLPRAEPGRRDADIDTHDVLPGEADTRRATPGSYLFLLFALLVIGVVSVRSINTALAPMLLDPRQIVAASEVMSRGVPYGTYDLNIETRLLRRESIRRLEQAPELAVMGASHWQEAHAALTPGVDFYNAHVHRDYYEDIVAVAGWFVRFDRLPKRLIISIRDNQFTPPEDRTDFLWVPGLNGYRETASIFGLETHGVYGNGLTPQLRQANSLPLLVQHTERFLKAGELPQPTNQVPHPTLDVLLPEGGIYWSLSHRAAFTAERTREEALALADAKRFTKPPMDPEGIRAFDRVLSYLVSHGVEVYLTHPPFNPIMWDAVQDGPYREGLRRVEQLVQDMAERYGLQVIGSFDPYEVGCTAEMYIDGEHSNPNCLGKILAQAL